MIVKGKVGEGTLVTAAFLSERLTSATIYYNGQPYTNTSGLGFDTQDFEDCMCALNTGTILGPLATLINSVMESDTDDITAATDLSGTTFTNGTTSADEQVRRGNIVCRDTKRYLFLKTELQGTPVTADFSAMWIGGNPKSEPTNQYLEFDV